MGLFDKMLKTCNGDHWSREKIDMVQKKRLNALVKFAGERSPFYKELYADIGDDYSLADIPPVSKPELMARFDDVLTDRNINMDRIDAFTQDPDNIGRMIDGKYLIFK
nr:phenylacetate--CoA ligase family protein [Lachnospiraceae bacterium]